MATVDIENRDPGGTDPEALIRRVNACTDVQKAINQRMRQIQSHWASPGPPDAPTALNALIDECNATIQMAQRLLPTR
jgi:hypothetical protein